MSARPISMARCRCLTAPINALRGPSVSTVTLDRLTQVAEQPLHRALGLTDWEVERIRELLGRDPNHFELAVFSLLWSEHCGYKHSALLLRRLPSSGERVLQGPGENAGVIDLGDGVAVAFKVETPQPPVRGRAVPGRGDGGRRHPARHLRDGRAADRAARRPAGSAPADTHFDRAVAGIGHYGNCVGVPNVGGETVFDEAYAGNCLVNAMCVGPARRGAAPVARRRRAPATSSSSTARRPAATASAARPCSRARSSARTTPTSARPSRSATRSRARS